jgi:hypothetical protein
MNIRRILLTRKVVVLIAVLALLAVPLVALADSISGDADALVLQTPHTNSLSATQNGGTTVSYPFSAVINNTGNSSNDVFPGSVVVSISRDGNWLSGGTPTSFTFTAYDSPQSGEVEITVPCGSVGRSETTTVDLDAGASSNGKSLNPNSVSLFYTITAGPDDPSCAPSMQDQTITFGTLSNKTYGDADFNVSATASSGLPVSFAASGNCTISGGTIHITGAGSCTITASQAGNSSYNPAPDVSQSFDIAKAPVTATAGSGSATYDGATHAPSACVVSGDYTGDLTCANNLASVGPNAGTTAIAPVVSGTGLDNFEITSVNGSYTIDKANADCAVAGYSVIYDGNAHTASGTCTGVLGESLSGLNLNGTTHTFVGNYTDNWTFTDVTGNYNDASGTVNDKIIAWTLNGFYQPVDMNGVYNVVKGGSTVPLKFEVFAGPTELTATSVVKSFTQAKVSCDSTAPADEIEVTTTGGTSLRYDATAGQFIQNWQTPKTAGVCYRVTMTTQDDSTLIAFFKLK